MLNLICKIIIFKIKNYLEETKKYSKDQAKPTLVLGRFSVSVFMNVKFSFKKEMEPFCCLIRNFIGLVHSFI
jgi:hypothetical protein